jgi:hypothetical protein
MKYYCKNCGSILKTEELDYSGYCPICYDCRDGRISQLYLVPDYETPAQYLKRTGKAYPDDGAVWLHIPLYGWRLFSRKPDLDGDALVIADPLVPPPDDFMPEGI